MGRRIKLAVRFGKTPTVVPPGVQRQIDENLRLIYGAKLTETNRFDSALDLEQTLMRYVALYNTQLPQSVLGICFSFDLSNLIATG